ncbi:MAG: hypothetical protein AB8B47_13215 [Roseobacter sp.]
MNSTGWEMFAPELIPGVLLFFFGLAVPVSAMVGVFIRRAYRRAVIKAMRAPNLHTDAQPVKALEASRPNRSQVVFSMGKLMQEKRLRPYVGMRHALAGCAYAMVVAVITIFISGAEIASLRTVFVFLALAVLPGAISMVAVGVPARWLWPVLFLWCVVLTTVWEQAYIFLLYQLGVPLVILAALSNPFLRTTAMPVYLGTVVMLLPALFTMPVSTALTQLWFPLLHVFNPDVVVILQVITVCAVLVWIGFKLVKWMAVWIGRVLQSSSEFMMLSDTAYLITTLWFTASYWTEMGASALCLWLAFFAYRLILWACRPRGRTNAPMLLLLRVFGHRNTQQKLARGLLRDWRVQGPVILIGAEDLATETLDSEELAAYMTGDLARLFVTDAQALERALPQRPVALWDGLYAFHDLYCRADSWQPTVETMMNLASNVVLDLRGFGPENAGVQFEINALAARVPAENIRVIFDQSTDLELAKSYFENAFQNFGQAGTSQVEFLKA